MATGQINSTLSFWDFLFTEIADPRTNDWPLIKSPIPGATILVTYWYFVLSWGPKFMANRKPFKLEKTLIVYNFLQVIFSVVIVYECLDAAWLTRYSWTCQNVDRSETPQGYREARMVYLYFLAKMTELLDTVFFVLRKRERQISFLHIYHHSVMPVVSWGATKYFPGGHGTFIGLINSFVHVIMYTYYMLAAFGPQFQKYLWWKKYITNMQMIQFCIAFCHNVQLLWNDCGYPRWSVIFTLPNAVFFYFLFNDFYKKSYIAAREKDAREIESLEKKYAGSVISAKKEDNNSTISNNNNNYNNINKNIESNEREKKTL